MQPASHRVYTFGDFALDLTTGSLLRNGDEVKLRPKAFETLRYFVQNPNRLISKDELVEAVWTDSFVTDNSLVKCLQDVRAALNDEARIVIKTIPRRGYIFAAEVSNLGRFDSSSVYAEQVEGIRIVIEDIERDEPSPTHQSKKQELQAINARRVTTRLETGLDPLARSRTKTLSAAALVLTLLGGAGYYFWTNKPLSAKRSRPAFSMENVTLTNLTSTGDAYAPVISPNGKVLAYVWLKPGGPALRLQQLATGSVIEIAPPTPDRLRAMVRYWAITFSADGNYVYYTLADDGENAQGTLFRVSVLGGHSQRIMKHVNSGGHESPDGRRLAFVRSNEVPGLSYLMTSNTDGTNERVIHTIDTNSIFGSLDWSPDGVKLLYAFRQYTDEGYLSYLAEIPADGGPEFRITTPEREKIIAARWLPDKGGLIMNAVDPETHLPQLYYVAYPDGARRRITNDLNNYKDLSVSADSRNLVVQINGGDTHLWLAPVGDARPAVLVANSTRGWYRGLSWTPDNELVYESDESGAGQICKMKADGGNRQQLTNGPGRNTCPAVTPDGRFIVFVSTRAGSAQIWRMTANGDDPVQLTHSSVGVSNPQISPDGQWVFYEADVLGRAELWKTPINGGEESPVQDVPVELWSISPDGETVAYSFYDPQYRRTRVAVRRLDAREPFRYFEISPEIRLQWTRDGRALTYVQPLSGDTNIWLQPLEGGPARQITALTSDQWIATFDWSLDGKTLAYTRTRPTFDAALLELKGE
jgi:Tol biopolymer transport system component/DNA-binding winged helix-turn-helix (wHTH) protein